LGIFNSVLGFNLAFYPFVKGNPFFAKVILKLNKNDGGFLGFRGTPPFLKILPRIALSSKRNNRFPFFAQLCFFKNNISVILH